MCENFWYFCYDLACGEIRRCERSESAGVEPGALNQWAGCCYWPIPPDKVAVPTSEDPDMTDRTVIIRSQGLSWLFLRMPDGSVAKRAGYLSKDKSLVTMHWEAHSHLLCHLQKFQRPLLGSEAFIHMTYMCIQMAHVAHIHTQTHTDCPHMHTYK